jgi:mannose-1-phosphate guanylyltransferase
MRAILLAAGYGTRLRPLTNIIPKCLVPINGKPLLDIWLTNLSNAGIKPCLINTHYLSDKVESYLKASRFQSGVVQVHEEKLLGTAGTLIANSAFFEGGDGLLAHADNYCLADFKSFIHAHINRPAECLMTMMVFRTDAPSNCGIVELDRSGVVNAFYEKIANPPSNLANGAVYLLSKELISKISKELPGAKDFSTEVLPSLIGRIFTYETRDVFIDIGSPDSYQKANLLAGKYD